MNKNNRQLRLICASGHRLENRGRHNVQLTNDYENVSMLITQPGVNARHDTTTASPATLTSTSNSLPTPTPYQDGPVYGNVDTDAPVSKPIKVAELTGYVQKHNADGGFATEYKV